MMNKDDNEHDRNNNDNNNTNDMWRCRVIAGNVLLPRQSWLYAPTCFCCCFSLMFCSVPLCEQMHIPNWKTLLCNHIFQNGKHKCATMFSNLENTRLSDDVFQNGKNTAALSC